MLKNLLNKLIKLAGHKLAKYVLAVWCFFENIFFPFPSDAIVIPMSISKPKRWFETFTIAPIAAFAGATYNISHGDAFIIWLLLAILVRLNISSK